MHIARSETVLGQSNYEKICEIINSYHDLTKKELHHPGISILHDYICQLDAGVNEHDASTRCLVAMCSVLGELYKAELEKQMLKTNTSVVIETNNE